MNARRNPAIRFPKPLSPGSTIAVTAPSSGVSGAALLRLDAAISLLESNGFRVLQGDCLRSQMPGVSASPFARAVELMDFLLDPEVDAVLPPWGGDLAAEILDHVNFQSLRHAQPKWVMGYSDISTILLPLTLVSGWATAHGPNLMELTPEQKHPLVRGALSRLQAIAGETITQFSSDRYQSSWSDFVDDPHACFRCDQESKWWELNGGFRDLEVSGLLVGGCLDTLMHLAGSRYADLPRFIAQTSPKGVILYLESVELHPSALTRALLGLKWKGWFDGISALILGRSPIQEVDIATREAYIAAVRAVLGQAKFPVVLDADIGHLPPQMLIINGATGRLQVSARGTAVLTQAM